MKYTKFQIQGYKAIEKVSVTVGRNNLIPIIGVNESGKTSILEAILSFDKSKDDVNGGRHLQFKNRYEIAKSDCSIDAYVIIESQKDIDSILGALNLNHDESKVLQGHLELSQKKELPFVIRRSLGDKNAYELLEFPLDEKHKKKFIANCHRLLPYILYFDDFSDRVPEKITFPSNYGAEDYKPRSKRSVEWQDIIEEIFRRTHNCQYTVKGFFEMTEQHDREAVLSDIQDTLNREIIEDWKALKKRGRLSLADDQEIENMGLAIKCEVNADGSKVFRFIVEDKSSGGRKRTFNITERSKGFQWFFNFAVKLKFNAKYKNSPEGAIYLLDEPGSYLHTSAQEELLKELKGMSEKNTILYCTHSQHLLDPDIINVASVRIAAREEGKVLLHPFGSSRTKNTRGALTPILDALHLRTGLPNTVLRNVAITEGITDYYFFRMLQEFTTLIRGEDFQILPGAGADQLKDLISYSIACADSYLLLLDNDEKGRSAYSSYKRHFGDEQAKNFYRYNMEVASSNWELENFFSRDDAERLKKLTNCSSLKDAITALFFMSRQEKETFFRALDSETKSNLRMTTERINDMRK